MYWLLAREVLRLRGDSITRDEQWEVLVDMFKYRDPEKEDKRNYEDVGFDAQEENYTWDPESTYGASSFPEETKGETNWDEQLDQEVDVGEGAAWSAGFDETETGEQGYDW